MTKREIARNKKMIGVLEGVLILYTDPTNWTKGAYAGIEKERVVDSANALPPSSKRAVCWCLSGAVRLLCGKKDVTIASLLADTLTEQMWAAAKSNSRYADVTEWNDFHRRTIIEVRRLVERTIEYLREENLSVA